MLALDNITEILNGYIMPFLLVLCGVILAVKIRLFKILSPKNFFVTLSTSQEENGTSPMKAMCTALAGTLGVGNIAGVATALSAGGAGALMWMWIGAIVSMSVKYGEVALAVKYRRRGKDGFYGGSMYTIKDGLSKLTGKRTAVLFGGSFAVLCIVNSLVTGNIVQTNSASAAVDFCDSRFVGLAVAVSILLIGFTGQKKVQSITFGLIPLLSLAYILLSMSVILRNAYLLPEIVSDVIKGAFSVRAAGGGALGLGVRKALRFGITRGIFSNEAGCGTAPSAHASADVKSPHHQGCFGIFEVVSDTLILCSMSAFVILIADKKFALISSFDGVPLTLEAFKVTLGDAAYYIVAVSVVLFALATVMAQLVYGNTALSYFTKSKYAVKVYVILTSVCAYLGSVISTETMWQFADLTVGVMTVVNTLVLLVLSKEIGNESPFRMR